MSTSPRNTTATLRNARNPFAAEVPRRVQSPPDPLDEAERLILEQLKGDIPDMDAFLARMRRGRFDRLPDITCLQPSQMPAPQASTLVRELVAGENEFWWANSSGTTYDGIDVTFNNGPDANISGQITFTTAAQWWSGRVGTTSVFALGRDRRSPSARVYRSAPNVFIEGVAGIFTGLTEGRNNEGWVLLYLTQTLTDKTGALVPVVPGGNNPVVGGVASRVMNLRKWYIERPFQDWYQMPVVDFGIGAEADVFATLDVTFHLEGIGEIGYGLAHNKDSQGAPAEGAFRIYTPQWTVQPM
jgi:hypothetical protein